MKKYKRITVKVGSNVLTRPDGTLDTTRVSSLVDQISLLRKEGIEIILVTSGAVACGRSELRDSELHRLDDVSRRQLFSAVGQVKLINRYYDLFRDNGIRIGQVLTMKENFSTRTHYLNQRNCMLVMLDNGILPVVNENDTVSLTELMFTDNDELSGLIATMLDCDALILLSNIDGIFDGNPNDADSRIIKEVNAGQDLSEFISTERSGLGRGGMVTKYNIARKVASEGIDVIVANGKRENILLDIILNDDFDTYTRFNAGPVEKSNMKRWIAHSESFTKGKIIIDDKAVEAVKSDRAVSLLPVGVVSVEGEFEKDELVDIHTAAGERIGIGRTSYSSAEARDVVGKHGQRPVVHYDFLYLL